MMVQYDEEGVADLDIISVTEQLSYKTIKMLYWFSDQVAADCPNVSKKEGCTNKWMKLSSVLINIHLVLASE